MSIQSFQQQAEQLLLTPYNITESTLTASLDTIKKHDIDYADLYFQYTRREGWSLEEGIVKNGSFSIDMGVGIRAVTADKTAFAYSDEISPAALSKAASAVRTIGAAGQSRQIPLVTQHQVTPLYPAIDPIKSMEAAAKVALLEKIEQRTRAYSPKVIQVMASITAEYNVIYIARYDGLRATDVRPLIRLSLQVIVEQDGRREQGSAGGGGRCNLSYFTNELIDAYVKSATEQALLNLDARPAPAGQMTVVLGAGWPGILLHEAIGHGLEGDFNRKGTSAFSGKIGERVAAKGVTIVDDGTLSGKRGSLSIDDEGQPTQCTTLIEDGILRNYMQDQMNARLMGMSPTGNGRRESYACIPIPRMTNTYMLAGQHDPAEIIASVKNGIYAANFGGGQVDITNGRFVFSASEAWRIENGKLTYPIRGATLIGNGPEVLNHVSMIGNNMALDTGVGICGKDGQGVPVGVGQPTLKIDGGLTVGGTNN